jgi:hypothetical protein
MPLARNALIAFSSSPGRRKLATIKGKLLACRAFLQDNIVHADADPDLEERLKDICIRVQDEIDYCELRLSRLPADRIAAN